MLLALIGLTTKHTVCRKKNVITSLFITNNYLFDKSVMVCTRSCDPNKQAQLDKLQQTHLLSRTHRSKTEFEVLAKSNQQ